MSGRRLRSGALLIAAGSVVAGALAPATGSPPARLAARHLIARQASDGSIGTMRSVHGVAEALASLVAGGQTGSPVGRALRYIAEHGPGEAAEAAGRAGLVVLGLVAAGEDPRSFAGTDYLGLIRARYNAITGEYDDTNLYANALAALGVLAAGDGLPAEAERFIRAAECRDGGFGWRAACLGGPDVDTTAMVVTTLRRAGRAVGDPALARSRAWLAGQQKPDGGFGLGANPTNTNSTGLVLSALAALGDEPTAPPWRQADGDDPLHALHALQTAGGGLRYSAAQTEPDDLATVQAIPGLAGLARPIAPRTVPDRPASRGDGDSPAGRVPEPAPIRSGSAAPSASTTATARSIGAGDDVILGIRAAEPRRSRAVPIAAAVLVLLTDVALLARRRRLVA